MAILCYCITFMYWCPHYNMSTSAYQHSFSPKPSRTGASISHPFHLKNRSILTNDHVRHFSQLGYKKGAEIYPMTNQNSYSLEDSFPLGIIPSMAQTVLDKANRQFPIPSEFEPDELENEETSFTTKNTNGDGTSLDDDGFSSEGSTSTENGRSVAETSIGMLKENGSNTKRTGKADSGTIAFSALQLSKFPLLTAITMVGMGLVPPSQILFVAFFSGYLIGLNVLATSFANENNLDSVKPVLPNLPPQGHVPDIMTNPLGTPLTESSSYQNWLRCGASLGYVLPIAAAMFYKWTKQMYLAQQIATSVFIISCQIITESIGKRFLLPLPMRILVPLVYNAMRMGPLYDLVHMGWSDMAIWGRALALVNFIYWGSNLFFFLIPVASLRYLRSHFFCVEAEEVVLRERF